MSYKDFLISPPFLSSINKSKQNDLHWNWKTIGSLPPIVYLQLQSEQTFIWCPCSAAGCNLLASAPTAPRDPSGPAFILHARWTPMHAELPAVMVQELPLLIHLVLHGNTHSKLLIYCDCIHITWLNKGYIFVPLHEWQFWCHFWCNIDYFNAWK